MVSASASASGFTEKKVGDLTLKKADATQLAQSYRQLSRKLQRMAASGLSPYAGGITISGKQSVEQETDRVKPRFSGGQFDNASADDLARPNTSTGP